MLIQNARLTATLAIRGQAVRAILVLTGLGFLAAQWPGLFDAAGHSSERFDRIWSTALLGAAALAAYIPIQRWDQVRVAGALTLQSRGSGFPAQWILGVWLGSIGFALTLPALAAAWLLLVSTAGFPNLASLVALICAVSMTAALAIALSIALSRTASLLAIASMWTLGAILSQARLPAGDVISIILPPVRILTFATRTHWAESPVSHVESVGLLAVVITAAALASAVGMARSRWN